MASFDFDLFTLGAGSGGVAASRRAALAGARVAICEERRIGGTCVLRGCVPKKLLMYGARVREALADAAGYGWTIPPATLDWGALIAAKDRELDRLSDIYARNLRDAGVTAIAGRGRVVDPHTVEVDGRRHTARHILVATGSRPHLPELPGIAHAISSDEALALPALPGRVVIVGGGYIGVEFAGIFHAAGAAVTLVVRGDGLLRGFDDELRRHLAATLRDKGIDLRTDTCARALEANDGGLRLHTVGGAEIAADVALFATGRVPNTRDLGLVELGVRMTDAGAVAVDEYSRSSVPSVYAVGDVTDRVNLTPVAIAEGRALADTLFRGKPTAVDHDLVPSAVFSQPPLASVGLTESAARARHGAVDVYAARFRPMQQILAGRDEKALMKLVVDRASQRVVGVHMIGPDAPEILQGLAVAVRCGATKAQFDATIAIHPTIAEEFVLMRDPRPDP
jgi:glutathione reductase (NADPH)